MITEWDFTRIRLDVEYEYYLNEEEQPHTHVVFSSELVKFIIDEGLANYLRGDDEGLATEDEAWDYLINNYDEVVRKYWEEFLEGELDDEL